MMDCFQVLIYIIGFSQTQMKQSDKVGVCLICCQKHLLIILIVSQVMKANILSRLEMGDGEVGMKKGISSNNHMLRQVIRKQDVAIYYALLSTSYSNVSTSLTSNNVRYCDCYIAPDGMIRSLRCLKETVDI